MVVRNNRRAPKTLREVDWREQEAREWRERQRDVIYGAQWVNVYRLDRHQGGHEEGWWFYDSWDVIESIRCRSRGRAEKLAERLRVRYLDHGNRYRSNYWNKPQDYDVRVEKEHGEDGSNYEPWC